jgi:rRNA-processing protein FCF1
MRAKSDERTTTVILDSNFLFVPLRFGVDIFEEFRRLLGNVRCVVPSPVLEELRLLRDRVKTSPKEAEFALSLAGRCETVHERVEPGGTVDGVILRLARGWRCPVATNDSELRQQLRSEGIPVIYLRQRAYLEIEGVASLQ